MADYKIQIRSYEVFNPGITEPAVHHEIAFLDNDNVAYAFNGLGFNKDSGKAVGISLSSRDTTLRIVQGTLSQDENELLAANTIFSTDNAEDFYKKVLLAMEAGAYINAQKLDYVLADPFSRGQNSNAAAFSMIQAMDLEGNISPEIENLWAPGFGRSLLENDFKPALLDMAQQDPDRARLFIEGIKNALDQRNIESTIAQEERPHKQRPDYDDRGKMLPYPYFQNDRPSVPHSQFVSIMAPADTEQKKIPVQTIAMTP